MFLVSPGLPVARNVEFVERKGRGHPDSIADALAELVSYSYAQFCLEHFGAVLHHYVDKLTVLGGEAIARPGEYRQVRPFRVLLNGRFSRTFGNVEIPVLGIAREAISAYLPTVLPRVEDAHWELVDNTNPSAGSSAKGWNWWAPRDRADIPDLKVRRSNDTSVSVASWPFTSLEAAVLDAEQVVYDDFGRVRLCGTDVKIMASRFDGDVEVTACVPVLAGAVRSRSEYDDVKGQLADVISKIFAKVDKADRLTVTVNTRDDVADGDIYLLGLGSSLEHGDEGVVGRGNRANGLITTETPMSMDAPWGKNPVYFSGHVYDSCARFVSRRVHELTGVSNSVYLASQNGREISDPWRAVIRVPDDSVARCAEISEMADSAFTEGLRLASQLDDIRARYPHLAERP